MRNGGRASHLYNSPTMSFVFGVGKPPTFRAARKVLDYSRVTFGNYLIPDSS